VADRLTIAGMAGLYWSFFALLGFAIGRWRRLR
jgi:hypothetical protein